MPSCCLCDSKPPAVSLHSFPKTAAGIHVWKQVCNFKIYDDVSRLRICSNHFLEDDYGSSNSRAVGGRLRLQPGRFPSVNVPNKLRVVNIVREQEISNTVNEMALTPEVILREQDDATIQTPKKRSFNEPPFVSEIRTSHFLEDDYGSSNSRVVGGRLGLQPGRFPSVNVPNKLRVVNIVREQEISNTVNEMALTPEVILREEEDDATMQTPKKRTFHEPRFVSEIKTSHLATPGVAKRTLNLAINQVKKLERKNDSLRRKNRRLLKKVASMEEILKRYKQNNSLSEEAVDH